jgi:serine/threonine protein kinase
MLIVFPAKHPHCGLHPAPSHLADFGFTRITTVPARMSSEDFSWLSSLWSTRVPSKEADNYALGMTVYQVLTGKQPVFPRREAEVIHAVISMNVL